MNFLTSIIVNAIIFMALSGFWPTSFHVSSIWVALGAAVILAVLNVLVKPIIKFFSFPITIVTLGLFSLLINGFMLEITSWIVGSQFWFSSFWVAVGIAILMSIINMIVNEFFSNQQSD
ncbi:phage holin family protein [Lentilactobacillus senioris]|uniref:phage holin family protein n=1 Tax=Lentilactobacillus senioris TaxID=931534 RepID=UPI002281E17D|nr:phage holin family protein [Lentilactobacillus senioris]MCY9807196.1 phage holin family protein [Lentilactobacillus senioris]